MQGSNPANTHWHAATFSNHVFIPSCKDGPVAIHRELPDEFTPWLIEAINFLFRGIRLIIRKHRGKGHCIAISLLRNAFDRDKIYVSNGLTSQCYSVQSHVVIKKAVSLYPLLYNQKQTESYYI